MYLGLPGRGWGPGVKHQHCSKWINSLVTISRLKQVRHFSSVNSFTNKVCCGYTWWKGSFTRNETPKVKRQLEGNQPPVRLMMVYRSTLVSQKRICSWRRVTSCWHLCPFCTRLVPFPLYHTVPVTQALSTTLHTDGLDIISYQN